MTKVTSRRRRAAALRAVRRGRPKRPAARAVKMAPEVRAYLRKLDAYRAGREPITLLRSGPGKIARAVAGLTRSQLRRRPARGKWSILEILGHLVDTEIAYGYRDRLSLAESGSAILGYDQAVWVREFRYRAADPKALLEQMKVMRRATLDLVERLPRRLRKRYGQHSERGKQTVQRNLELIAGHDLNHLDQIQAIKLRFGW